MEKISNDVRAYYMFYRILKLRILNFQFVIFLEKIGFSVKKMTVILAFFDLFCFLKTNYKFQGKNSGFVYSGFVKTCDELITGQTFCKDFAVAN